MAYKTEWAGIGICIIGFCIMILAIDMPISQADLISIYSALPSNLGLAGVRCVNLIWLMVGLFLIIGACAVLGRGRRFGEYGI